MCADRHGWATTVSVLLWTALVAPAARGQGASPGPAQATLPLDEILRLYRESEERQAARPTPPSTQAAVQRVELQGRLLDDAVILEAHFDVVVLIDGAWVEVPLLQPDPELSIPALPAVEGATLLAEDGALRLVTAQRGRYSFDVTLHKRARVDGPRRTATLQLHSAMPALLRLRHDPAVFTLRGSGLRHDAEGAIIHPQGARLSVAWQRIAPASQEPAARQVPIEPVVTAAHASLVSTLEGRPITRLRYQLRFSGQPGIALHLPPGQSVARVFVNGVGVPFAVDDGVVQVRVQPARAGDEGAVLELTLLGQAVGYNLSGRQHHAFPSVSWTVNEFWATVHLPAVFTYAWTGGSLAPVDSVPAVDFTERIPEPGRSLHLHQVLVAGSSPAVDVDYTIDLQGQYFTAR